MNSYAKSQARAGIKTTGFGWGSAMLVSSGPATFAYPYTGMRGLKQIGTFEKCDAATGNPVRTLKGHSGAVQAVAFAPDGKLLASGGGDGTAKVWETASGKVWATLEFLRLRKQRVDPRLAQAEPLINVESVAFSPDGRTLVASAGVPLALLGAADRKRAPDGLGEVTFWSTRNYQEVAAIRGFGGLVRAVAFSPDGKLLATAGSDGLTRLWDADTHRKIGEMNGAYPIAFSPDGRELVSSIDERTLAVQKVADAIHP